VITFLVGASYAHATPLTIWNPGFEIPGATAGVSGNGLPTEPGKWAGDASEIVGPQNGIVPLESDHMLRFLSSANPLGLNGISSDIWQLIDMTGYSADIATGHATVTWSAYFNRILGDAQTEPQFSISVRAFAGVPAEFAAVADHPLADTTDFLFSDGDPTTWQQISASLLLPTSTSYIGVRLAARETLDNSAFADEFAGHYADYTATALDLADDTALDVPAIPEPGSLLLVGSGAAALAVRRRRGRASR
jgi:hypothetical protein